MKFDPQGALRYVSPVLRGLTDLRLGNTPGRQQLEAVAQMLTQALEMAAGLRERTELLERLSTAEAGAVFYQTEPVVISFSGGVADCIETVHDAFAFGDLGPVLGQTIRASRLCAGEYRLGTHTIRATVIGAGCHSAQLSGSTVFCKGTTLPVQNLPVVVLRGEEQENPEVIAGKLRQMDSAQVVLAVPGYPSPGYSQVAALAEAIAKGTDGKPVFVCVEQDMAKALGQRLSLLLPDKPCLCIDRLRLEEGSFLDIGNPVGPCMPVVIKTLILSQ